MPWVDFRLLKPVLDDVKDVIRDGIGRSRRVVRDFRPEEPIEVDETAVRIVPDEGRHQRLSACIQAGRTRRQSALYLVKMS